MQGGRILPLFADLVDLTTPCCGVDAYLFFLNSIDGDCLYESKGRRFIPWYKMMVWLHAVVVCQGSCWVSGSFRFANERYPILLWFVK